MAGAGSEADLVREALAGDAEAFVALCERHRARVWRIAATVAEGAEVDDLAQEAIIRAFSALKRYRAEAPFGAWLCRIALNAARDWQRSAWRRRIRLFGLWVGDETGTETSPEGAVLQRELQRRVRQAVAMLPEPQRAPIWLHYFDGFSLAEVARLEGVPEATLRSRLRAGLRRLSLSLEDLLPQREEASLPREPQREGCGT